MEKLASNIVGYIATSTELTSRLQRTIGEFEREKQASQSKTKAVLQALLDSGCVLANNKEAGAKFLETHSATLDLVANMATKIAELAAAVKQAQATPVVRELGSPSTLPATSSAVEASTDNYVGRRFRREKSASDRSFLQILNPPTV